MKKSCEMEKTTVECWLAVDKREMEIATIKFLIIFMVSYWVHAGNVMTTTTTTMLLVLKRQVNLMRIFQHKLYLEKKNFFLLHLKTFFIGQ